jgi:hypothetical protein
MFFDIHDCLRRWSSRYRDAQGAPVSDIAARRVLERVDRGNCTAVRGAGPQFVSEGCYDTNHPSGDCAQGDWCSMGRIAYYDGLARHRLGMHASFNEHILAPIQRDVLRYTWLHERYNCQGQQSTQRTAAYFEFPSVVTMLLREVRYGIDVRIQRVTVAPLPRATSSGSSAPIRFVYAIGDIVVDYTGYSGTEQPTSTSGGAVHITVPGVGHRECAPRRLQLQHLSVHVCDAQAARRALALAGINIIIYRMAYVMVLILVRWHAAMS